MRAGDAREAADVDAGTLPATAAVGEERSRHDAAALPEQRPCCLKSPAASDHELLLAPVRLSLPTKVLGLCWYCLAWMVLPPGPIANAVLALCCGLWVGSELCRLRRFAAQEWICRDLVSRLSTSALFVSRVRIDNLVQLQKITKDVVASTTQTPSRCVLESAVVMAALWLASILPGILWEIGLDAAVGTLLATFAGTEWLAQTAKLTDDAELLRLVDQLVKLDKLVNEQQKNPTAVMLAEERWRAKWGNSFSSSLWSNFLALTSGGAILSDAGEEMLFGVACFAVALLLWWLLRRSTKRCLEHRLIMTKVGCVDLLLNIITADQAATVDRPVAAAVAEEGRIRDGGADPEREPGGDREGEEAAEAVNGTVDPTGDDEAEDAGAEFNAAPRLNHAGANVSQLAAGTLALIAATCDAALQGPGLMQVEAVQRILAWLATTACDASTSESLTLALQEVLAGRLPGVVLLAFVKALHRPEYTVVTTVDGLASQTKILPWMQWRNVGETLDPNQEASPNIVHEPEDDITKEQAGEQNADDFTLKQMKLLVSVMPKQGSSRVRQAVSHTGLVGTLLHLVSCPDQRPLVLSRINAHDDSKTPKVPVGRRRRRQQCEASAGPIGLGSLAEAAGAARDSTRKRVEVMASNIMVRLATQLEWEASEKTPVLDETTSRLCSSILQDPCSRTAEKATVLLAVIANSMVNSQAYMRLYEPSAESMPLRLEQVRLDLKKLRSEPSLVLPRAQTLLQGKMLHFGTCTVPCLARVLVSDASNTAKAAASLCIAIIALLRPAVVVPASALESMVALLDAEDAAAMFAIEALSALAHVPATQSYFDEQGVVEMAVRLARRRGSSDIQACAASFLELLATRRRLYRSRCRHAGAEEVLRRMQENGNASVRDAASAALTAISRTWQDDVAAMCSSTGYIVLVIFCFFVQLGGVHAVMDVMEVLGDIAHLLSRITSVRRNLAAPSVETIMLDFLVNDPMAFCLMMVLVLLLPGLLFYVYLSQHLCNTLPSQGRVLGKRRADNQGGRQHEFHRSWLLGFTLRQEVLLDTSTCSRAWLPAFLRFGWLGGPTRAGQPYTFKYLVTEAMPDGPCKHSIREGDQLLSIDGHDVSVMDLAELVLQARGREDQEPRCTLLGALARTFSRQLDPVRRLMGFKVMPRAGRGSRAHIRVLRCKKDGRQVVKDILLTRGNWVGMFDDAARNGGTDSHGTADSDRVGILTWLRDLRRSPEREGQEMTSEAGAESLAANEPEDERVCRICQCSEDEAPEFGKLFTPCLCRGTMRFVHHVRCP